MPFLTVFLRPGPTPDSRMSLASFDSLGSLIITSIERKEALFVQHQAELRTRRHSGTENTVTDM
jgi:hypothetical protein